MMVHSHPTHEYTTFECWFYKLTFSYMEKLTHCLRDCKPFNSSVRWSKSWCWAHQKIMLLKVFHFGSLFSSSFLVRVFFGLVSFPFFLDFSGLLLCVLYFVQLTGIISQVLSIVRKIYDSEPWFWYIIGVQKLAYNSNLLTCMQS